MSNASGIESAAVVGAGLMGSGIAESLAAAGVPVPPLLKRMVASGRLGRKSGRGFYEYE